MNIQCADPHVILHPYANENIMKYGNYYIRGDRYDVTPYQASYYYEHGYSFNVSPKKFHIDQSEVEDCYIVDNTGILLPLYLVVPCGKCELCTEKKKIEWVCRAMCESQTSISEPLWIGLSYNDEHLPEHGVNKSDVQKFMKRLRIRLTRAGYDHDLRYFLCAEYGSDDDFTHRAHYHMCLWNFPILDPNPQRNRLLQHRFIEQAWSKVVSEDEYLKYRSVCRFVEFQYRKGYDTPKSKSIVKNLLKRSDNIITDDLKKRICRIKYFVRLGFVDYKTALDEKGQQRLTYCMKYMHKDSIVPFEVIGKYNYSRLSRRLKTHKVCEYVGHYDDPITGDHVYNYLIPPKYHYIYPLAVRVAFERKQKVKVRLIRRNSNKLFFLSSRKNAIGKEWLINNRSFFDKHPNVSTIKITDRWSGKEYTYGMPRYFKDLLFPSLSRMVPKETRDKFKEFNLYLYYRNKHSLYLYNRPMSYTLEESSIIKKYKCLNFYDNYKFNKYRTYEPKPNDPYHDMTNVNKSIKDLISYLQNIDIDSDYIINIQNKKSLFTSFIIEFINNQPDIPIHEKLYKVKKQRISDKIRYKGLFVHRNV